MVFVNCISKEIGYGPDGLSLPANIVVVDDNYSDYVKTDAHEYPNGVEGNAVDYVEVEAYDVNDRSDNIGPAENDEAAMLDKIVDNIEANAAKAKTKETTRVGGEDNSVPNVGPTEMVNIITGVGIYTTPVTSSASYSSMSVVNPVVLTLSW